MTTTTGKELPQLRKMGDVERARREMVRDMFLRQILSAQEKYDRLCRELETGYVEVQKK
jgi:hypothetical protein